MVIYGGVDAKAQKEQLKSKPPHIVVGTPGRIKQARRIAREWGEWRRAVRRCFLTPSRCCFSARQGRRPEPEERAALRAGRVRQDAGGPGCVAVLSRGSLHMFGGVV